MEGIVQQSVWWVKCWLQGEVRVRYRYKLIGKHLPIVDGLIHSFLREFLFLRTLFLIFYGKTWWIKITTYITFVSAHVCLKCLKSIFLQHFLHVRIPRSILAVSSEIFDWGFLWRCPWCHHHKNPKNNIIFGPTHAFCKLQPSYTPGFSILWIFCDVKVPQASDGLCAHAMKFCHCYTFYTLVSFVGHMFCSSPNIKGTWRERKTSSLTGHLSQKFAAYTLLFSPYKPIPCCLVSIIASLFCRASSFCWLLPHQQWTKSPAANQCFQTCCTRW